jgi:hypothetical protein
MNLPRFSLGHLVSTPCALRAFTEAGNSPQEFLDRHVRGDWGDLSKEDREENEFSLTNDLRILSAYQLRNGTKIWIITEADRSSTCMLLPEEY